MNENVVAMHPRIQPTEPASAGDSARPGEDNLRVPGFLAEYERRVAEAPQEHKRRLTSA